MTPHDFDAPTLCFSFHCDCNGGMSALSHQRGWQWHLNHPRGTKCCCPRSLRLLPGPPVLPRCAGCVLSAWFGWLSLCLFAPCLCCTGFPRSYCPFSTSRHWPWPFPSPVNVHIVSHSVSSCPRQASQPTGPQGRVRLLRPFARSACRRGHFVQDFSFWS